MLPLVDRRPDVPASFVPKVRTPTVRKALLLSNPPDKLHDVRGDVPLLVARERLIGDQGEDEFGEGRHGGMIASAVSPTASPAFPNAARRPILPSENGAVRYNSAMTVSWQFVA